MKLIKLENEKFKFLVSLLVEIMRRGYNPKDGKSVREISSMTGYSTAQIENIKSWLLDRGVFKFIGRQKSKDGFMVNTYIINKDKIAWIIFVDWQTSVLFDFAHNWFSREDLAEDVIGR